MRDASEVIDAATVMQPVLLAVVFSCCLLGFSNNKRRWDHCFRRLRDSWHCLYPDGSDTKCLQLSDTSALDCWLSDRGLSIISYENQSVRHVWYCKYRHLSWGQEFCSTQLCMAASNEANRRGHKSVGIWMLCLSFLSAFCGLFTRWMAEIEPKDLGILLSAVPCY